jgi:hypothetical protein
MAHYFKLERYRFAAGRLRMRAEDTPWADIRDDYFELARRCERLAERLEQAELPRTAPPSARPSGPRR